MNRTFVVGVGMTKFEKPGTKDWDYPDMGQGGRAAGARRRRHPLRPDRAGVRRLLLRRLDLRASAPSTSSGSPASRSTTSTTTARPARRALYMARQSVEGGLADCALRSASRRWRRARSASSSPTAPTRWTSTWQAMIELRGCEDAPPAPQLFGNAGREHMERYGTKPEHFARIGWKNHKHSVNNPYSQFQDEYSLEDIKSRQGDLRAADQAAVLPDLGRRRGRGRRLASASCDEHGLWDQAVEIAGKAMATDLSSTFDSQTSIKLVGSDMTPDRRRAGLDEAEVGLDERRRGRAARLLLAQRADHLRGARARRRGRGARARRRRGDHLRRRRWWSTRRAA